VPDSSGLGVGPDAANPRVDLTRSRSAWEIVRSTLRLYSQYPWLFFVLAALVVAPWELLRLIITGYGPLGHFRESFLEKRSLELIDLSIVTPLISVMHIQAVSMIGEGRRPHLGRVVLKGLRMLPVAGTAVVGAGIAIEIGFIALVIPGILLSIRYAVVAQAAAVEQRGVRQAWRSSWKLTNGYGWHVFGLFVVAGLPLGGVALGAALLATGPGTSAGSVALGIALHTVLASFVALTEALLYFDLIARRSGVSERLRPARGPRHPTTESTIQRLRKQRSG
jgi:hypothetical protein